MPELDSIRGIAILGVVLYHGFYWGRGLSGSTGWHRWFLLLTSPGQFGVNLFFVLSGFLISGILLDSRDRPNYYARFYYRRALRILPAYYFTILLLILFGITSRGFLLMSLAYCSNLSGLFGIALSYPVLWSLAVEEQFYLLWPTAVKRVSTNKLIWLLVVVILGCPVSRVLYHLHAVRTGIETTAYYYTWNTADGLALGALLAVLLRRPNWGRNSLRALCTASVVMSVLMFVLAYPQVLTRNTPVGDALQSVCCNLNCVALLGLFLLLGTSSAKWAVTPRILIFFGKISYGLYLYHVLFYRWVVPRIHAKNWLGLDSWGELWANFALGVGMAVLFSYASRRYFEEPFLRLKDMLPKFLAGRGATEAATDVPPPARMDQESASERREAV